ncbi:DUF2987 domain-containing protein [Shewanella sp. AS1]|uniref:DUF2987 domain-containing protein n=1 Tax=Shewanella sp. AS1 TaxID=2907626 RepID=UPI001F3078AA|nr:DUF2987 domain-containing protein [Shewanella sp. AS1]MCE9678464.1 DUF2987 domain-containing protein [Shewanella sp. AS1]
MNKGLLFSCLLGVSCISQAAPITLEYQGFYQRLKQLNSGHYPLIDLAFSVPKQGDCIIKEGSIRTEKEVFPLVVNQAQRIFIPYDDRLKSDRALIQLEMVNDASQCGIGMQIRAKQTQHRYRQAELIELKQQMNDLYKSMQGFPLRYFSSDIDGLTFEFDDRSSVIFDGEQQSIEARFTLSASQIDSMDELAFDAKPTIISPWFKQ